MYTTIQEAMDQASKKKEVAIRGWVYRERGSNKMRFIVLRDSTNIIQCVIEKSNVNENVWNDVVKLQIEASVEVKGTIKKDTRAPSGYEILVKDVHVVGWSDTYPITKDQSNEHLLDNRHLWIRSRKMTAILKIRSTYLFAREEFFQKQGFWKFDPPILQPNQCEGGSTLFEVKYYNQKTYLSQTWQLYAEAAIFALERVYDHSPTFRAEKSKTSRHLSEFWMAEMEAAWMDLSQVTEFAKKEIKYCLKKVLEKHEPELELLGADIKQLKNAAKKDWPTLKYREVLKILEKSGMKVKFGKDLRTEEEEAIMKQFDTPIVVTHYPKSVMAFYKPVDPEVPDEALCFDMLGPNGTEIVGGSQRSTDMDALISDLKREGEDPKNYKFYLDLRKYGSVPHSGYGVGVERVLVWICNLDNIKDAIGFPRTALRWTP
ncbi:MAG: asparagine--tRNA ligase [Nanoarchaeota archaeon]|nr:asparagine--tRNA ligase [Nanoarchaeota archaeon]